MIGNSGEAAKVAQILANVLRIERNSLCFCGSGQKWKNCCGSGKGRDPLFIGNALRIAQAYKTSKGTIDSIPAGIWKRFERASFARFTCLYPGCTDKPVNCHLVPENVLRSYFGGHCKEYRVEDAPGLRFLRTGIGGAACLPVFCGTHDNSLFTKIDQITTAADMEEHRFLLALKATAFSLRKTQGLLGIDSQIEIARPFLLQGAMQASGRRQFAIDISNMEIQYIRYKTCFQFYKEAMQAHTLQHWNYYLSFHRVIRSRGPVFFSGLINPSHDLQRRKINDTRDPIIISCNVFAADDGTHVLLSCPAGPSSQLYGAFLRQLENADDQIFRTALNNILTISAETLLMPESFEMNHADAQKVRSATGRATVALKGDHVFDLIDTDTAVMFV